MTMLDRMRRHKSWLKWSLAFVVLAFVALYIPDFLRTDPGANPSDAIATVDGRKISVARFRRVYNQQMTAYRNAYGNMDDQLLRQLGLDQRIVQQLIEEEAQLVEAERQGIGASDAEVRARIWSLPAFQENGQFIGDARYRQYLGSVNPPIRPNEFEEEIRRSITVEKLQSALTDWMTVSDTEVTAEFNRRNEKVKLSVVSFQADAFRAGLTATDAEIAAHFETNKEQYRIPERRKVQYALIDLQGIRAKIQVSEEEIKQFYDANTSQYETAEQVQASHILLKTQGKDDAAVKKQAEELLAKLKGGADFADLAKKSSEDTSAASGGDLGLFGRGAMVKPFEDVAFALAPGQTSDLVKTEFGYHIIKVTDKKPASSQTFDQVRATIEDQLRSERATKEMQRIADDLVGKLRQPADLEKVGRPAGLTVSESPLFGRGEPIAGLGVSPAVSDRAFELSEGQVSEAVRSDTGLAFVTVTGIEASRLPSLDDVKARVKDDVVKNKAVDAARARAKALAAGFKSGDFAATAKSAGLEVKTTELLPRGAPVGDLGQNPAVEAAAFALPANGVSDPIDTDTGAVVIKVVEKQTPSADELKTGREGVKQELLTQQKSRFLASYMTKARERITIEPYPQVIAQVVG